MTTQDIAAPTTEALGEPCPACGTPMARDQRYCLTCGARHTQARLPFRDILAARPIPAGAVRPGSAGVLPPDYGAPSATTRGGALPFLIGLGCLLLALLVGVLIGRSGGGDSEPAATPTPQVITVKTPAAAAPTATAPAASSGADSGDAAATGDDASGDTTSGAGNDGSDSGTSDTGSGSSSSSKPKSQSNGSGASKPEADKPIGDGTSVEEIG